MQKVNKQAGGVFIMAALLIGFIAGIATGDAVRGVWIGLAVGILAAVGVWLNDRRQA